MSIRQKTYGPFEVIGELSGQGRVMLALPFEDVMGARVLVSLADNYGSQISQGTPNHLWPGVEITIWGTVQSYENMLKRTCIHSLSGPMSTVFSYEDGWDQLLFRARNMNGGSVVNLAGIPPFPTQATGFSLKVSVLVMPRSGFETPGDARKDGPRAG